MEKTTTPCFAATKRFFEKELFTIGVVFFLVAACIYIGTLRWHDYVRDAEWYVVGRDFLNFWMAGRFALTTDPSQYYDVYRYGDYLSEFLQQGYRQEFSYPPHTWLLAAPFGLLPYGFAWAGWMLLSLGCFVASLRLWNLPWRVVVLIVVSPVSIMFMICGQNSMLTAAAIFAVFAWMDRRPILAGCLLALLTVKPQLGLLFPIMLLATRRYRCFFAAACFTIIFIGSSVAIFGIHSWQRYYDVGIPQQMTNFSSMNPVIAGFMPTMAMEALRLGVPHAWVMNAQFTLTLFCLTVCGWVFRHKTLTPMAGMVIFLGLSIVATPYLMGYDALAFTAALLAYLYTQALTPTLRWLAFATYWLPGIRMALNLFMIPGAALLIPFWVWWTGKNETIWRKSRQVSEIT